MRIAVFIRFGHCFNIIDMLNKSRGDVAYTLTDVDNPVPEDVLGRLARIEGVMTVRVL